MTLLKRIRAIDHRLTGPGSARTLTQVRTALVLVIGLRLLLRDWWLVSTVPVPLFDPVAVISWMSGPPSRNLVTALWVVGLVATALCAAQRRPQLSFAVAWVCLLVLCATWSSTGKVMHNDILLLWASVPMVFVGSPRRGELDQVDERWCWAPRASLIIVAAIYFVAGFQKLNHSGLAWVFSDNLSWVLRQGSSPVSPTMFHTIARFTWLTMLIAGLSLVAELLAPVLLGFRRTRLWFLAIAFALHGNIWMAMGLDYGGWVLTVAAVTIPLSPAAPWLGQRFARVRQLRARPAPNGLAPSNTNGLHA